MDNARNYRKTWLYEDDNSQGLHKSRDWKKVGAEKCVFLQTFGKTASGKKFLDRSRWFWRDYCCHTEKIMFFKSLNGKYQVYTSLGGWKLKTLKKIFLIVLFFTVFLNQTCKAQLPEPENKTNGQIERQKKKPFVWIALLPRSPIRSTEELYLYFWGNSLVSDQTKIDSFELEIRSANNDVRISRIDSKSMITVHKREG